MEIVSVRLVNMLHRKDMSDKLRRMSLRTRRKTPRKEARTTTTRMITRHVINENATSAVLRGI